MNENTGSGSETTRTLVSRTIEGTDVLVSTEPGEIFLDIPATSPRYIRVEEGGVVQEGDVRGKSSMELESASLKKWRIAEIGSHTVRGVDLDSGESREWDRKTLETRLGVGEYSTDLTDFERVSVTQAGGWDEYEESDREKEPYVMAIVYGNNGRKFTQTYRFVEPGEERLLELARRDRKTEEFDEDLRARFEKATELALRSEGFAL